MKAAIEMVSFIHARSLPSAFDNEQIECQFSELKKNLGQNASMGLSIKQTRIIQS